MSTGITKLAFEFGSVLILLTTKSDFSLLYSLFFTFLGYFAGLSGCPFTAVLQPEQ